uniref:hypothetical protein n=1 Tax=Paenibacillus xylanexedens TaxID=528191 RepID=UPI0011A6FDE9
MDGELFEVRGGKGVEIEGDWLEQGEEVMGGSRSYGLVGRGQVEVIVVEDDEGGEIIVVEERRKEEKNMVMIGLDALGGCSVEVMVNVYNGWRKGIVS